MFGAADIKIFCISLRLKTLEHLESSQGGLVGRGYIFPGEEQYLIVASLDI